MQINTSALLGMLGSNLPNNVKEKIQDASSGGKTDISRIVKDKTIQTLLGDTFKSLVEGTKDKGNILQTLQNSKHMFDIKSFSNDIKNISGALAGSDNPKLQQQSVILKDFFVNIKNLDENVLKSSFSNSGVMLESKLNDIASLLKEPALANKMHLQKNLQELAQNIKSVLQNGMDASKVLDIKNNMAALTKTMNSSPDLQSSIKTAVSNLLNNINNLSLSANMQLNPSSLNSLLGNLQNIESDLSSDIGIAASLIQVQKGTDEVSQSLKNILSKGFDENSLLPLKKAVSSLETVFQNTDMKQNLKSVFADILGTLNSLIKNPLSLKEPQILNSLLNNMQNISQELQKSFNEAPGRPQPAKLSDVANLAKKPEVSNNINLQKALGEINNSLKNISFDNLPKTLQELKSGLSNLSSLNIPADQKAQGANLLKGINTLVQNLNPQSLTQQQNLLNSISREVENFQEQLSKALTRDPALPGKELLSFLNDEKVMNTAEVQKGVESLGQNISSIMNSGISDLQVQTLQNTINTVSSSLTKGDMLQLEVKNAVNTLLNGAKEIARNPNLQPRLQVLSTLAANASNISSNISNLPLQLPAKAGQVQLPNISGDIKAVLLKVSEELNKGDTAVSKEVKALVEKTLTQVEYFQALSYSSSSNHTYLPFSWENIEEGDIKFASHGKDNFSCQINLQMKEYGEIRILLELEKKNYLNINIGVADDQFKAMIQEKLQLLRKSINGINLNLQSMNLFELNKNNTQNKLSGYNSGDTLDFGLDIKV